jgi:uncharacterized membrane protein
MLPQVIAVVSLAATAIVSGVFFAVAVSVLPALFALPPGQYVVAHRLLGAGYHPVMPLLVSSALIADVALAVLARTAPARALAIAGAVAIVGVQVISQFGNVPINRVVHATDPNSIQTDWADPRPAWRNWHLLRTGCAVAALTIIAAVVILTAS